MTLVNVLAKSWKPKTCNAKLKFVSIMNLLRNFLSESFIVVYTIESYNFHISNVVDIMTDDLIREIEHFNVINKKNSCGDVSLLCR